MAKNITLEKTYSSKEDLYKATEKNSIICQLENLLTYPYIDKKIVNGVIKIHGWYYNLEDGSVEFYDKKDDTFKDIFEYQEY